MSQYRNLNVGSNLGSYVCLMVEGLVSPVGPGKSIAIPCEGRIPAASLSTEDSDSSFGGGIGSKQADFGG